MIRTRWNLWTKRKTDPPKRTTPRRYFRPTLEVLEERCLLSVDTVLEWNSIALNAVVVDHTLPDGTQTGPVYSARALAIVQAAVYDAVNSIDGSYTPYLTVAPDAAGGSIDAAAAWAAHDTLVALYPLQQASFDAHLTQTLARIPDGPAKDTGRQVGEYVASQILQARSDDGRYDNPPYTATPGPGVHQADPLHPDQGYYATGGGSITPFAIPSEDQFLAPPPPALDSYDYALAYFQVKALGGDGVTTPTLRTPEQTEIGIFWGYDGSPGVGTPPVHYNEIAQTIAIQQNNTEVQNARLFALVNIALADAGFVAWDTKYTYDFWRPVLAIRETDPANPFTPGDPNWTPLGMVASNESDHTNETPNFPSYTSGHAAFGAALFETLTNFYGTDNIQFTIGSDEFNGITRDANGNVRPIVFRSYDSFSQAALENAESRIYLGIHWQFDADQGIRQGDAVADYVFANILQPVCDDSGTGSGGDGAARGQPSVPQVPPGHPSNGHAVGLAHAHNLAGSTPIAALETNRVPPFDTGDVLLRSEHGGDPSQDTMAESPAGDTIRPPGWGSVTGIQPSSPDWLDDLSGGHLQRRRVGHTGTA